MKRGLSVAIFLFGLATCMGCKATMKRVVLGILQPDRSSGASNPSKQTTPDTQENQISPPLNGASFLNPTACDPTDADGDPDDDICPPNPPPPVSPS